MEITLILDQIKVKFIEWADYNKYQLSVSSFSSSCVN